MGMNDCVFSGRLTKAPETSTTPSGKMVSKFSVAVNRGFGDNKTVSYPRFVAWEKQAEFMSKLNKGDYVEIRCEFEEQKYTNNNGEQRTIVQFKVREVEAIKTNNAGSSGSDGEAASNNKQFTEIDDTFLPF